MHPEDYAPIIAANKNTDDARMLMAFSFTLLPAIAVALFTIYYIAQPNSLNVLLDPLGILLFTIGLVLVAIIVKLPLYIYSLRVSSLTRKKILAALLCLVPSLGIFMVLRPNIDDLEIKGRLIGLSFFGCYFLALISIILNIVNDLGKKRSRTSRRSRPASAP
jgi:uncharacterized membrane protein (GlpM family)